MSNLIVRLLLSILLVPLALIFFVVLGVISNRGGRTESFWIAALATWSFVAVYWIVLWRQAVRWNSTRTGLTVIVAFISALISFAIATLLDGIERGFGDVIGSMTAPLLWLAGTVLVWRESAVERMERLRSRGSKVLVCPACGYNLTGLREVRCPECGMQMTLDELIAAQPSQAGAELNDG